MEKDDLELISMFRFVDLRKYGVHTSALLLDALGVCLVNSIGDAMGATIRAREEGSFSVKHTLGFTALVLTIGFGIRHLAEFVRVRLPQQNKEEAFSDQMIRFMLVLSSRACSYLGGFVIQLALAEWVIQTHAEYMLGDKRAHEAMAAAESHGTDSLSASMLPNLDTVKIPAHAAHHVLVALKARVMQDPSPLHDFHNASVAAAHHVANSAEGFKNATMSIIHDEHLRFEVTLVVTFAMFALLITILGVGFVMITQVLSDKYEARLVDWKHHKNEEGEDAHD